MRHLRPGRALAGPSKPFFFRAPPVATEVLALLGVDCVTLANNHALDYGPVALLDTLRYLDAAGIAVVGAGPDELSARSPVTVGCRAATVGILAVTDHPASYAAGPATPGVAYADLRVGQPAWLLDGIRRLDADVVLVCPHWGPNMVAEPVPHVRAAASAWRAAGATLVAGTSAHVFHGAADGVLFDLGDFLDDYVTDPVRRNDLGLLFLVTVEHARARQVEAVPIALDHCRTRLAEPGETDWVARRFSTACAALGTVVQRLGDRLVLDWDGPSAR